jgi:phosphoethanolamine N-methyltransferase
MLGSVAGLSVLELGAGIGRFTGPLAETAAHVTAVDFMANLIAENEATHGPRFPGKVTFRVGDATELDCSPASFDVVFSNWLLMYLGDAECAKLAADALTWVKPGGTVFFRESCFRQSGDRARATNPTHYRDPRAYFALFDGVEVAEPGGGYAHYELVSCRCVDTYVRLKQNQNQLCWKWKKVVTAEPRPAEFRHFLDGQQYSTAGILKYERIFGDGFVSTGGAATTRDLCLTRLALRPGETVLDVGCGIGGGDFLMAAEHGVHVRGLDLSVNMVLLAMQRAAAKGDARVRFEIADILTADLEDESFDVVYSRDTILHIPDKRALFARLFRALKPGGRLLITDYCRAAGEASPGFASYIADRGYDLWPVTEYGELLSAAGFADVAAEDVTDVFESSLRTELARAEEGKAGFVAEFSDADFAEVTGGWRAKLDRVAAGEQKWGLFYATKPVA